MSVQQLTEFTMSANKKPKLFNPPAPSIQQIPDQDEEPSLEIPPMTPEQLEIMSRALENPLLLHKIINTVEFPELKILRLVSKSWQGVSSEVMYKRDLCQVRMTFDEDSTIFRRATEHTNVITFYPEVTLGSGHLKELNKVLENSSNFPCSDFIFRGGDLSHTDPQKFFDLHGAKIRTLYMYRNSSTPQETFRQILLGQAPSIKNLTIAGFQYTWPGEEDIALDLPCLKIFEWGYATPSAHKILQGAKNLKIVKNFRNCDNVDLVSKSSTIFGIKALDCHENDKPETWQRLASEGLQLNKLTFRVCSQNSNLFAAYQDLLRASKNSLKFLELSELWQRTGTRLPRLENLRVLEMGFNSGQRIFQPRINLNQIFPRLQSLDCSGLLCMDDKWEKYFPSPDAFLGTLPTVENLKICDDSTLFWMQKLGQLCPNFKTLTIQSEEDNLPTMLPQVFQLWPALTGLLIRLNNFPTEGLNLDSTLTGFPAQLCDRLWSLGPNQWSGEAQMASQSWKIQPSLCDLKGLRRLEITMACEFKGDGLPVSCVSGIYGFKLLPQLTTLIQFDHQLFNEDELITIYTELIDFANIEHKKRPFVE